MAVLPVSRPGSGLSVLSWRRDFRLVGKSQGALVPGRLHSAVCRSGRRYEPSSGVSRCCIHDCHHRLRQHVCLGGQWRGRVAVEAAGSPAGTGFRHISDRRGCVASGHTAIMDKETAMRHHGIRLVTAVPAMLAFSSNAHATFTDRY